jgi:hypothetical protein
MDDAKIDLIAREVLTSLKKARAEGAAHPAPAQPQASPTVHASLQLLSVPGGVVGSPCIIEPDKPCVGSLRCRTFGH